MMCLLTMISLLALLSFTVISHRFIPHSGTSIGMPAAATYTGEV